MPRSYATTWYGASSSPDRVGLGGRDLGDEIDAVGGHRSRGRGAHRVLVGAERAGERTAVAQVASEASGVDPRDRRNAEQAQEVVEVTRAAPVARATREVAHDRSPTERARALEVVVVHAVVADVRIRERDHLPRVRRVGEDLLVARERRVEDDLADRHALATAPARVPSNSSPSVRTSRPSTRALIAELSVDHDGAPAQDRVAHLAGERATGEGRVAGLAGQALRIDLPAQPRVEHAEVRVRAGLDRDAVAALEQPGDGGRPPREQRERLRAVSARPARPARSSVSASAVSSPSIPDGASSNGRSFASVGMRRVVGGDGVDGAVGEPGLDRRDVGVAAQRRIHLEHRVERRTALVGEREVVRRGLRGDREAARLGGAHELDRARRGHVQEVQTRAPVSAARITSRAMMTSSAAAGRPGMPSRLDHSPSCIAPLPTSAGSSACCAITAPGSAVRVLERAPHHAGIGDAIAVVGEDAHAEAVQLAHRRELADRRDPS